MIGRILTTKLNSEGEFLLIKKLKDTSTIWVEVSLDMFSSFVINLLAL